MILGLRWSDVDVDSGHLSITQTLVSVEYELRFSEPETPKSRRSIAIDAATAETLRAHRRRQLEACRHEQAAEQVSELLIGG